MVVNVHISFLSKKKKKFERVYLHHTCIVFNILIDCMEDTKEM